MARILVVDDNETILHMIVAALETAGHDVSAAMTGNEALALFVAHPADVVITDIMMPDDNIEAVLALRCAHPDVPFIVVSGLSPQSPRALEFSALLCAARSLPKPFRLPELLGAVEQVLDEQHLPMAVVKKAR
jgi:two-component system, chemotaxis family, chemotaxis protein CheY